MPTNASSLVFLKWLLYIVDGLPSPSLAWLKFQYSIKGVMATPISATAKITIKSMRITDVNLKLDIVVRNKCG